jgi:hypothetical protein
MENHLSQISLHAICTQMSTQHSWQAQQASAAKLLQVLALQVGVAGLLRRLTVSTAKQHLAGSLRTTQ